MKTKTKLKGLLWLSIGIFAGLLFTGLYFAGLMLAL